MTITKVKSVNKRWLTVDEYYSDNGLALVSMDAKHPLGTFDYTFRKDGELKVSTVKLFGGEVPITSFA